MKILLMVLVFLPTLSFGYVEENLGDSRSPRISKAQEDCLDQAGEVYDSCRADDKDARECGTVKRTAASACSLK